MTIIHKKLCMIGDFAVGKTSLVRRFLTNVFSEDYITTVGVKIETRTVSISETDAVKLVVWDIAGADKLDALRSNYLLGAAGFLLVADGTRRNTLESVFELKSTIESQVGTIPSRLVINKTDLRDNWELTRDDYEKLAGLDIPFVETSAKSGEHVETVFLDIARELWRSK